MPERSAGKGTRYGRKAGSYIGDPAPASRGMVVMACDAALRFLETADAATTSANPDAVAMNVDKAQRILLELMGSLDRAVAPEMTETLECLYQTLLDRLSDALNGDCRAITETRLALKRLRNAWMTACRSAANPVRGSHACTVGR